MADQAGFISFIRTVMGITPAQLPDNAPVITVAFSVSVSIVNPQLQQVDASIYDLAVYNLAGDRLLNYAPDVPGSTFFADVREKFGLAKFFPGVINSSSDESTSQSILNPDFMHQFTLSDLQRLKTPYGRQYLEFAQECGSLWGVS